MKWFVYLVLLCGHIGGLLIFLRGFFPSKVVLPGFSALEDSKSPFIASKGTPQFKKMVLIIVDAMRADFVFSREDSDMRFVHSLIEEGAAIPFTAFSNPPTVTLPRLKGIVTGGTPSFLDAILNVADDKDDSQGLSGQDSWIRQLRYKDEGKKIHFYGDDTWLKLFPSDEFFEETEGTNSFFVSDFTEVDNNVTRHLDKELAKDYNGSNWDALILHYLGLDHIGHKGGPSSPFMKQKHQEMDAIVKRVYNSFGDTDDTLIVLMGDHGMNEVGNHGGSSAGETNAGLVFISPKFKLLDQNNEAPLPRTENYSYYRQISQIDLVPTLAALLDFPIPKNSLGVMAKELIGLWNIEQRREVLYENCKQIRKLVEAKYSVNLENDFSKNWDSDLKEIKEKWDSMNGLEGYYEYLYKAQAVLASSASNYNMDDIWIGFSVLIGTMLVSVAFYIHYFKYSAGTNLIVSFGFLFFAGFYSLNFFASSFIEEEHHIWWFLTTIILMSILAYNKFRSFSSFLLIASCLRGIKAFCNTGQKFKTPNTLGNFFSNNPTTLWTCIIVTYSAISMMIFCQGNFVNTFSFPNFSLRNRNPSDFGPLLSFVSVFVSISLSFSFKLCQYYNDGNDLPSWLMWVLVWIGESFGIDAKSATKKQFQVILIQLSRFFVISDIILVLSRIAVGKLRGLNVALFTDISNMIIAFLIHQTRVELIPIFLLFFIIKFQFAKILSENETRLRGSFDQCILMISVFTLCLQNVTFFSMGNTNSLATVDLSNAYNGIASYDVIIVGVLTFISSYIGPIFWSLTSIQWLLEHRILHFNYKEKIPDLMSSKKLRIRILQIKCMVSFTFYSICIVFLVGSCINLRYHLFIWTVFSPKLLFFGAWSFLINSLVDFILIGLILLIV